MLKSQPSSDKAYVVFVNDTSKTVDAIWHDFNGNMVRYGTLRPGEHLNINTFSRHPWKSFDIATGKDMLLNGQPVYFPVSVREIHERLQMVQVPLRSLRCQRSLVNISASFESLSELCHEIIMQRLNSVEEINMLEIPELLKCHLRQILVRKLNYLSQVIDHAPV